MRFAPVLALIGGVCALHAVSGSPSAESYRGPVHAQLIRYINVRHLQTGSSVFLRVSADWTGVNCTLRQGAIIEGKVESAAPRAKGRKGSELALSFSKAQCSGAQMAPLDLVLAAVSYVPEGHENVYPVVRFMRTPGVQSAGPGASAGGNLPLTEAAAEQTVFTKSVEFRSMREARRPRNVNAGDVYGVKGVRMQLGAGPHHSSLLTADKGDLALEEHTEFLLVPATVTFVPAANSWSSSPAHSAAGAESAETLKAGSAAPVAAEEFEPCAPPACTTDLSGGTEQVAGHPASSIALPALGYAPRRQTLISELDHDDALAWIGRDRLLVAFNPHKLIDRDRTSADGRSLRAIRAVLLDTAQKRVVSTANWEISDSGRYLWQLSGDRLLAHVAHALVVYDAQLRPVARLPLAGPLDFVRVSPDGEVIAEAVLKERHSAELHARLREDLGHEPQEDVDVLILDNNFKTMAHASTTSDIVPPTLLNEGQLNVLAQPNHRYRLSMLAWDNQERTLARFSSACMPQLSTFAPDLVMVRSCEKTYGAPEIRVLRADGQVLMRGKPEVGEMGHEAKGNVASRSFAVKVLHTAHALSPNAEFAGSDLNAVELRVYRARDGKRLAVVRADEPAPSHDGYCLSPDGSQVAVLAGGQIDIFPVRAN